jgi:hypothetical protein
MNLHEARTQFAADQALLEERGVILPGYDCYMPDEWKRDWHLAMDAQPQLITTPNSAIPAILTTTIDPKVIRVVFAPLAFAKIFGEQKSGDWLEDTRMFPIIETTGEVSSYGDFNNNGRAGVNMNWPSFQNYLFQTFVRYGEREAGRAGLAKINYISELQVSAADILNRYANLSYAFGIAGLQNYGALNNPYLSALLTPATKAWGGTTWFDNGAPAATANEVYNDIVALWEQVIAQTNGAVSLDSPAILAMSPASQVALTFTNSFGVNVKSLLKENYPNMRIEVAPQYGTQNATNAQGYSTGGNLIQLIVTEIDGQQTAYAAFSEKLHAHKIIAEPSAWMQKFTSGTWGVIMRMPFGIAGMLGV